MTAQAKHEYLRAIHARYEKAPADEKGRILDEFCSVCHYHRKYAIRLLNQPLCSAENTHGSRAKKAAGRKKKYHTKAIKTFLQQISIASNMICSKRLKTIIPLWLPHYDPPLDAETQHLLLTISPATIDRVLAPWKRRHGKIGLATTKPGSLLKKRIPVKTSQWDESCPGFLEADTVAHCGTSMAGSFIYTVNLVDIATGWSCFAAVWGKGQTGVFAALESIEKALPFAILGFDSDNGSEFLNEHLYRYFTHRKRPVNYTRSRPYHKNDNSHIEQKNYTHIRQYLGYQRFDNPDLVAMMNDLYQNELPLLVNFFLPSFKLLEKRRDGSQIIKRHDDPKTPFERLSPSLPAKKRRQLQRLRDSLNPFDLHATIKQKVLAILALATPP